MLGLAPCVRHVTPHTRLLPLRPTLYLPAPFLIPPQVWAGATADPETERIFEETQAALAAEYGTPQLTRLTPGAEKPAAAGARKQPAAVGAAPQAEAKAAAPRPAAAPTPGSVALLEEAPLVQAASSALP